MSKTLNNSALVGNFLSATLSNVRDVPNNWPTLWENVFSHKFVRISSLVPLPVAQRLHYYRYYRNNPQKIIMKGKIKFFLKRCYYWLALSFRFSGHFRNRLAFNKRTFMIRKSWDELYIFSDETNNNYRKFTI